MQTKCSRNFACLNSIYRGFGVSLAILDLDGRVVFITKDLHGLFLCEERDFLWAHLPEQEFGSVKQAFDDCLVIKRAKCDFVYKEVERCATTLEFYFSGEAVFVSPICGNSTDSALLSEEKLSCIHKISDGIAHNFRSPLMALKNISDYIGILTTKWKINHKERDRECVCKQCPPTTSQMQAFPILEQMKDDIASAVTIMSDIIDGLRVYNKSNRNNGYVETDITDLLNKVTKLLEYNTHDMVKISLKKPTAPLPLFWCIPSDIQVVFINIIENAIQQITDRGIAPGLVDIIVSCKNDKIVISIKDNGGGIEKNIIKGQKLFEPFTSTKKTGSGLGLFISAKTILAHGGEIAAKNHRGKRGDGAEFIITLPIML